jgi:hypothetical protein
MYDDLDFVLYRMGNSCAERTPLRCMAAGHRIGLDGVASAPCLGATGLKAEGEGEQAPPGCAGRSNNFLAPVHAEAGDRFLLAVTNYSSRHGFRLDWGGQLLDSS